MVVVNQDTNGQREEYELDDGPEHDSIVVIGQRSFYLVRFGHKVQQLAQRTPKLDQSQLSTDQKSVPDVDKQLRHVLKVNKNVVHDLDLLLLFLSLAVIDFVFDAWLEHSESNQHCPMEAIGYGQQKTEDAQLSECLPEPWRALIELTEYQSNDHDSKW